MPRDTLGQPVKFFPVGDKYEHAPEFVSTSLAITRVSTSTAHKGGSLIINRAQLWVPTSSI